VARKIESDDELMMIHKRGKGFIFNYFTNGRTAGENNILHAASCSWLTKSNLSFKKYFFKTIKDVENWLTSNIGEEGVRWKKCGFCNALGQPELEEVSNNDFKIINDKVHEEDRNIFREKDVQNILVKYLKEKNYNVKEEHQVSSGIIDIVADKDDELIVIEVKGEDKGGYTSAEMNFQMGLGQIMSRMTSKSAKYMLAFPLTPNFKKVLKKYKKTFAFEKLGLNFYLVKPDDSVMECSSQELMDFLNGL